MRSAPNRTRWIALAEFLGGGAAIAGALLMPNAWTGHTLTLPALLAGGLLASGLVCCVMGVGTLLALLSGPSYSPALQRGEPPVARWTVDADTWRAFVELNDALDRQKGAIRNVLPIGDLPTTGVEIVVAPDGVCIGPDFYKMKGLNAEEGPYWLAGPPPYFEFRIIIRGRSVHRWIVRYPIAPGAEDQAERARAHFVSLWPEPPTPAVLRRRRNVALVIAGAGLAAFVGPLLTIPMMASRGAPDLLWNVVVAVGLMALPAGLFVALFSHRELARSRSR